MDIDDWDLLYKPAVRRVFSMKAEDEFDAETKPLCRKLEKVFPHKLYTEWFGRPVSEDRPCTESERYLLGLLASEHVPTIYKALCVKKGLEP